MYYITVMRSPSYHQMTLDEFLFNAYQNQAREEDAIRVGTRTYAVEQISDRFKQNLNVETLIVALERFNSRTDHLRQRPRAQLYHTFYIPKHSGGMRRIDAPNRELMDALRSLKTLLETKFHVLYHTSAYAYVTGRCTVDAVKRHQANNSKWFGKLDLSNFFGSTTMEFLMKQVSMIFPFCEVVQTERGKTALEKAFELGFLNGGLPQGTPLSPMLTNLMMIPIDFKLSNTLRQDNKFIYTRYADDFIISSKYHFDINEVTGIVSDALRSFDAPFTLNNEKTRYGSSSGRNWNLGVMLNKDNEITVGYKRKRQFKSMLTNYIEARAKNTPWGRDEIQYLSGLYSYYRMVERENIDKIVAHINEKYRINVVRCIKDDLRV